jgi:phosphate transport system protein
MSTHLEQELEDIKIKMFTMTDLAIEAVLKSIESLKKSDVNLGQMVIDEDTKLDRLEVEIDDECVRLLITRQPAAVHLRMVLAFLKINTDLERIGDLASNIARETVRLNSRPTLKPLIDIPRMAVIATDMIRDCFAAMSEKDAARAEKVIATDKDIDEINTQLHRELFSYMAENPNSISEALGLIMVAKALERIGDHATNIAERVIYYIEGIDIRHSGQ